MIGTATAAAAAGGRMLAWRVHGYEGAAALRLEEARVPPLGAPDELLVRVRAASLNPIDLAMLRGYGATALGAQRRLLAGGAPHVEFPLVPGRDFCGIVEARGPGVTDVRLRRGARVWGALPPHVTAGAHAQLVRARAAWLAPAPRALDDAQCGAAPYAAMTACALLRAAGLPAGGAWGGAAPRVLLLGLGGVGQAALQLLAAGGAHVVVGAAGEQRELARRLGAAEALDRHAAGYEEALVAGGPWRAVLDCAGLGGEAAGARAWRFSRYATLTSPLLRETDARGAACGGAAAAAALAAHNAAAPALPPRVRWAFFSARAADLELLRALADRGRFVVPVESVVSWREAPEAYARAARPPARGKLVLDWAAA